ncbi:MAG: amidase, partial [Rhodospirillaceae bacterium]|nr:amidase [Rhodospirillaceae bacterium]
MSTELHFFTLAEAALAIRTGQLSPVDYMESLLRRIEQEDTNLKAFITVTADQALEDAKQAENEIAGGNYLGPLHGIPYGIKDIIDVAGVPTTANSQVLPNYIPSEDATVVKRLSDAGAIVLGKTITHEFAHGGPELALPYGPARNPWNLERITGGSSAGSASAVASGMVPAALGTDT